MKKVDKMCESCGHTGKQLHIRMAQKCPKCKKNTFVSIELKELILEIQKEQNENI